MLVGSLVLGASLISLAPTSSAEPSGASEATLKPGPAESTAVEVDRCDGSRGPASQSPSTLKCRRWKVEWQSAGKVWGVTASRDLAALQRDVSAQSGFSNRYARLFDRPLDARFGTPSPAICEMCEQPSAGEVDGLWGEGQRFGGLAANRERTEAQTKLDALQTALVGQHYLLLEDAARLAKDAKTAKAAKAYVKALDNAARQVPALQLQLDKAAVFRSPEDVRKAVKAIDAHAKALQSAQKDLAVAVAREVERVHGGRYVGDVPPGGGEPAELLFEIDDDKATLTHVRGPAKTVWFEGNVLIDGRISGKSLVAPEGKQPTCNNHSVDCGFVYVPSIVRFTETSDPARGHKEVAELWFQQSTWIAAPKFSR